jgi:hypothetical protein
VTETKDSLALKVRNFVKGTLVLNTALMIGAVEFLKPKTFPLEADGGFVFLFWICFLYVSYAVCDLSIFY